MPEDADAMTPLPRRAYRGMLKVLQRRFPTLYPVRLTFTKALDECWGMTTTSTYRGDPVLSIRIRSDLTWPADFLVFIHEYAHAMEWRPDHQENWEHHSPEWGVAEARLWKWFAGETAEEK